MTRKKNGAKPLSKNRYKVVAAKGVLEQALTSSLELTLQAVEVSTIHHHAC